MMDDAPIDNPEWWKAKSPPPGSPLAMKQVVMPLLAPGPSPLDGWATVDPSQLGESEQPYAVYNMVSGKWVGAEKRMNIPNPMNKNKPDIFTIPDTQVKELQPFIESLRKVPKTGVHNPLKNNDRYVKYGEISRKVRSLFIH